MSFLMRGRSPWWHRDQARPAPEPVTQATGLPVAAPAPTDGTDDLSLSTQLNRASVQRLDERHRTETARCNCCDGTPTDRQWIDAELRRLEALADLTGRYGPWKAAQHMWAPTPTTTTSVKYWATLRGQR